jgi:hypothetical protein
MICIYIYIYIYIYICDELGEGQIKAAINARSYDVCVQCPYMYAYKNV